MIRSQCDYLVCFLSQENVCLGEVQAPLFSLGFTFPLPSGQSPHSSALLAGLSRQAFACSFLLFCHHSPFLPSMPQTLLSCYALLSFAQTGSSLWHSLLPPPHSFPQSPGFLLILRGFAYTSLLLEGLLLLVCPVAYHLLLCAPHSSYHSPSDTKCCQLHVHLPRSTRDRMFCGWRRCPSFP